MIKISSIYNIYFKGLGHTRLSIIDLEGGQQPISNETGDIQIVVNGELYDFERIRGELEAKGYKFKTKSDSEIALHLFEEYGLSFVEHLRGEFAICIYEAKRNRFIAVVDRFGIKPLYYTVVNGTLLVASEMKAFLPLGWKPEWDIDSIVQNGTLTDWRTPFKDVQKLPRSHYLVATSTGSISVRQYWDPDYPDKNVKETREVEDMVQGVRERLVEAVKLRLRADVPVGVYLSGGIDSSCIAGIAIDLLRKENPDAQIQTFSISFKDNDSYDESQIAERTAEFLNVGFHKLDVTEDSLLANLEEVAYHSELPQVNLNGVAKFMLSAFAHEKGYKVVLTGEGSDEHFAGYSFFHSDYLREPDHATPNGFGTLTDEARLIRFNKEFDKKDEFRKYMKGLTDMVEPETIASRMLNNTQGAEAFSKLVGMDTTYYSDSVLEQTGGPQIDRNIAESLSGIARLKANTKWHPLHTSLYLEQHVFLSNYLLNVLGDRSEMAHSIEARTPFLDHVLCEYVNGLPPSVKIKASKDGTLNEKWILKEAAKPYITEEIYSRTKHPFIAPASKGSNPKTVAMINRLINKETIDRLGWANTEKILKKRDEYFETGSMTIFRDLLSIMSFVTLSDRFNVATYYPSVRGVAR